MKVPQGMPLVRMKAAPVKTDGERLGNEFMNGVFFFGSSGEGDGVPRALCEVGGMAPYAWPWCPQVPLTHSFSYTRIKAATWTPKVG